MKNTPMRRLKLTLAPKTLTIYLQGAPQSAGRVIPELEYLGGVTQGWFRMRDGTWRFGFRCSPSALKAYRLAIKADMPKTHTLSLKSLIDRVNLIILGKAAYWAQAAKAVKTYWAIRGECHCTTALMRQRLRRIRLPQRGAPRPIAVSRRSIPSIPTNVLLGPPLPPELGLLYQHNAIGLLGNSVVRAL